MFTIHWLQDIGYTGLVICNIAFQIDATMMGTGLGLVKSRNAGFMIGLYSMCGSSAVIVMDELGGYLFKSNSVGPFLYVGLPFNLLVMSVSIFNSICC